MSEKSEKQLYKMTLLQLDENTKLSKRNVHGMGQPKLHIKPGV